jgi:hypothetical protein
MASRPIPHSFAIFAEEWGRHLTSPLTQHENYVVTNLVWKLSRTVPTSPLKKRNTSGDARPQPTSARSESAAVNERQPASR